MFEPVEFTSEDAVLRGRLYRPPGRASAPAVIMAHGTSATITMTADRYAEVFRASGLAVLLYDHRNFGLSGGEPRLEINPWVQARGYGDAIDFLESLSGIDRESIALWGDSYSAAQALIVAAVDGRPAAVVGQVPSCGRQPAPEDPDGSLFSALVETLRDGPVEGNPENTEGPLPVVSDDQSTRPSLLQPKQAYHWFNEYGSHEGTGWKNRVTRVVPSTPSPFHPGIVAPHLSQPVLLMVAPEDEMPGSNPDVTRTVFDAMPDPKEMVEVDGGHFGLLYHPGDVFDQASRLQSHFLTKNLPGAG